MTTLAGQPAAAHPRPSSIPPILKAGEPCEST